jgi:hypothetical protein
MSGKGQQPSSPIPLEKGHQPGTFKPQGGHQPTKQTAPANPPNKGSGGKK